MSTGNHYASWRCYLPQCMAGPIPYPQLSRMMMMMMMIFESIGNNECIQRLRLRPSACIFIAEEQAATAARCAEAWEGNQNKNSKLFEESR